MTEPHSPHDPTASDDERDAWLREALRHAPDSALSSPALLRESILSQARAAVAVAAPLRGSAAPAHRPAQRESAFAALWSWLARPPVAAGFASVMAATLVGMMWWDRPMNEAMPPTQPQRPALSPSPSSPPAAPSAAAESFATQKTAATPSAPRQPAAPTAAVARRLAPSPAADVPAQAEATTDDGARDKAVPFPAETKQERDAAKSVDRYALKKDDRPASPAAVAPVLTPARPAPAPALADNAAGSSDKERTAPERARQAAGTTAPSGRLDAARAAGAADAATQASPGNELQAAPRRSESTMPAKLARSAAAARPLASLLSTTANDASRVTRIGSDGRIAVADSALLRWLRDLDAATTGLWQALDAAEGRAGAALDLRIDGQPAATISVDATTVTLSIRSGAAPRLWRADVGAATAERLRDSLPR